MAVKYKAVAPEEYCQTTERRQNQLKNYENRRVVK
jgi:hypothetical protein